jgi:hypothetical protein
MKKLLWVVCLWLALPAHAETYTCITAGGLKNQTSPCGIPKAKPIPINSMAATATTSNGLPVPPNQQTIPPQSNTLKSEPLKLGDTKPTPASNTTAQLLATQKLAGEIEHQNNLNQYNSLYEARHRYQSPASFGGTHRPLELNKSKDEESHRQRHGHESRHHRRHSEGLKHSSTTTVKPTK